MISFTEYAEISDNYCICYFGYADEYLVQLKMLQPILEREFDGLNIYLGVKDEKSHILEGCSKILKLSEIKTSKKKFAHIRELTFNGSDHPVEALMKESGVETYASPVNPAKERTAKCVIATKGFHPTRSLLQKEIDFLKLLCGQLGYDCDIDGDVSSAGLVMGVESYSLYDAASRGVETRLVPTGIGTRLYKRMFPHGKILEIAA
jgi:hypothetical protein